jgi:hypothetical protein
MRKNCTQEFYRRWRTGIYNGKQERFCEGGKIVFLCATLDDPKIKQREINSLLAAMDEFDVTEGLILTLDESGSEKLGDKRIRWQPIWKWLLE